MKRNLKRKKNLSKFLREKKNTLNTLNSNSVILASNISLVMYSSLVLKSERTDKRTLTCMALDDWKLGVKKISMLFGKSTVSFSGNE